MVGVWRMDDFAPSDPLPQGQIPYFPTHVNALGTSWQIWDHTLLILMK